MSEKIDPDRNDEDRAAAPEISGEPAPESRPAEPEVRPGEETPEERAPDAGRPENASKEEAALEGASSEASASDRTSDATVGGEDQECA